VSMPRQHYSDDTVREAVQMVVGRNLSPEALTETGRAGLKAIL